MPKCKRARREKGQQWSEFEEKFLKWIDSGRSEGKPISTMVIRMKAETFASKLDLKKFKTNA